LLLRFWEYQEGEILLGGRDIRRFVQEEVSKNLAVVSQSTTLFNATVRENLLLARPKATEAEIVQASRAAQIHEFLRGLPDGYETWIGEQGLRLSGGERQRLAIARAVLKDAPILLLDEPTANLDQVTERELLAALLPLMEGRTTLLITHRPVWLEWMDEILVLRQGRIVERGRYADLLKMGGYFKWMWELQNKGMERSNRI
jgi:ATP-binding cassette subfamily C protein CydC